MGVVVDGVSAYGRGILRGVLRYANLERRWVLYQDLWRTVESQGTFPECDGAIVGGVVGPTFDVIRGRCKHAIYCSSTADPTKSPMVSLDDVAVGEMAAEHLMNCRLERFAFYGEIKEPTAARPRLQGFKQALARRGYTCITSSLIWPLAPQWLTHTHWPELMNWLRELPKPIGILAADDSLAHDLARVCLEADIGVPDHVAIIGVNNDDLLCDGAWPPLSSVEADFSRVGYQAAKMLDRLLAGDVLTLEEQCVRFPPLSVAQRVSTNVLAVRDPYVAGAVRYIREHACGPCDVRDVLRHVPVARRWLERQFVTQLGRTPHEEITRVRMEAAKRLLLQPDLAMPDIAARCGYSAVQNFTRVFRQVMKTTPAAYRRKVLSGNARSST